MSGRILMIEDDDRLAAMLIRFLNENGFEAESRGDGASGLETLRRMDFQAVILDVMLPDLDGFEVCRRIRAESDVPIVMLTARGDEMDRIVGLELGADDYLPKPFNPRELLARLRAVLRRGETRTAKRLPCLRFGALEVDRAAHTVTLRGETCALTSHQFDLLRILVESAGRPVSRETLMERLQGHRLGPYDRSIDVHVSRIRAAIEDDPKHPERIVTVRGVGYLFRGEPDSGSLT
jgi:DNA-binding response OmpR family regulator